MNYCVVRKIVKQKINNACNTYCRFDGCFGGKRC